VGADGILPQSAYPQSTTKRYSTALRIRSTTARNPRRPVRHPARPSLYTRRGDPGRRILLPDGLLKTSQNPSETSKITPGTMDWRGILACFLAFFRRSSQSFQVNGRCDRANR